VDEISYASPFSSGSLKNTKAFAQAVQITLPRTFRNVRQIEDTL